MGSTATRSTAAIEHEHERLEHLYEISKLFVTFENVETTFDAVLAVAASALPLRSAILIEVEEGRTRSVAWHAAGGHAEDMRAPQEHMQAAYSSLVGTAAAGAPRTIESGKTPLPWRSPAPRAADDRKRFIVIPLVVGHSRIFGALQLEGAGTLDRSDLVFVNAITNQLAIALDRHHAEGAQVFLNDAGSTLGESLDYPTALKHIARLGIPRLGDLCFFDAVTPDGRIERAAWAHADPASEQGLEDVLGEATAAAAEPAPDAVSRAIGTGESSLSPDVDQAWIEARTASRRYRQLLQDNGVRSVITVPTMIGHRTLGALTYCFAGSGRRHSAADLALAQEVARRAAFALENARLYEQAQQAIRVREQILAVVSHDLKNPLASILLNANLLAPGAGQPERRKALPRVMGRILRSVGRMRRLIDDLLDFASIEAGSLAITRRPHDVASMLTETIASFEAATLEKGLRMTAEIGPDLPQASCDRDRILQVISNLVGNALEVTPPEGRIVLRLARHDRGVAISVEDTGPGIGDQDLARIFERYWRGDAAYKGTGLGLAIASGIVRAHGSRIWAKSEIGHGATFTFTLPAADAAQTSAAADPATT